MPFIDQASLNRGSGVARQQLHAVAATGEGDKNGAALTHVKGLVLREAYARRRARCGAVAGTMSSAPVHSRPSGFSSEKSFQR